jgi:hypothetical protein
LDQLNSSFEAKIFAMIEPSPLQGWPRNSSFQTAFLEGVVDLRVDFPANSLDIEARPRLFSWIMTLRPAKVCTGAVKSLCQLGTRHSNSLPSN